MLHAMWLNLPALLNYTAFTALYNYIVCIFKVFIEFPLNLSSGCISMFSINLTFDKILVMKFCLFFLLQNRHFGGN